MSLYHKELFINDVIFFRGELAHVNDAPVLNKSAAREGVGATTEITREAKNSIKVAKVNNLPNSEFME